MRNEKNVHGNKSSIKSRTATAAAIAPAATAADLAKLGQQLLEQQRAIRAQIPDFILPHASQPALTGTAARVTAAAVNEGLAACETHPSLAGAVDTADVRYGQDYEAAFTQLRDEMMTSLDGLDYSIRLKRHNNAKAMLRILAVARSLVKAPENAGLTVYIEGMRKGIKRRRKPAAAPETPPETPAAPATQFVAPVESKAE